MKKIELIAKLEGAKELTSVVSIDLVIAALGMLEDEVKVIGISQELAEDIANRIERTLDRNASDFIDTDSAEFELNYDNRIELTSADVNVSEIMDHVTACLEEFVVEEEEDEEDANEALVQAVLAADSNEADEEESEE
jgi:hypothetical protein